MQAAQDQQPEGFVETLAVNRGDAEKSSEGQRQHQLQRACHAEGGFTETRQGVAGGFFAHDVDRHQHHQAHHGRGVKTAQHERCFLPRQRAHFLDDHRDDPVSGRGNRQRAQKRPSLFKRSAPAADLRGGIVAERFADVGEAIFVARREDKAAAELHGMRAEAMLSVSLGFGTAARLEIVAAQQVGERSGAQLGGAVGAAVGIDQKRKGIPVSLRKARAYSRPARPIAVIEPPASRTVWSWSRNCATCSRQKIHP